MNAENKRKSNKVFEDRSSSGLHRSIIIVHIQLANKEIHHVVLVVAKCKLQLFQLDVPTFNSSTAPPPLPPFNITALSMRRYGYHACLTPQNLRKKKTIRVFQISSASTSPRMTREIGAARQNTCEAKRLSDCDCARRAGSNSCLAAAGPH